MRRTLQQNGAERSPFGPYPEPLPESIAWTLPSAEDLTRFCRRWRVKELAVYGHALEVELTAGVPLEIMIGFFAQSQWLSTDLNRMRVALAGMLGHEVKLMERAEVDASQNPILRQRIFRSIKTLFLDM